MPPPATVRALLLDDSNFDRARIRRLSQRTGLCVELDEVGSIDELDYAVTQERYDLIMIDYRLPVGDGMQALNVVLQNPQNCDAGKIMITGDNAQETAIKAMRGGCHDFLTKQSIDAEALTQAMINAMTLARQRQQVSAQTQQQREVIKQGLVAALNDSEVQDNVVSLVAKQLQRTLPDSPGIFNVMDPDELDALLQAMQREDQLFFH
jgi:CheY-like chemotaxis protein